MFIFVKRSNYSMINHQQKGAKRQPAVKSAGIHTTSPVKDTTVTGGFDMTFDPELDKFSGNIFQPEKHKEDEARLANSTLPHSSPSFK